MTDSSTHLQDTIRANQARLMASLRDRYDMIVCGSGSSGSVVAARLAADPDIKILVLEAGGSDDLDLIANPNLWPMTLGSELDWGFVAEANPNLNGRAIPYSMGKVLGGGSSINVSTWSRGHKADWDFYARESGEDRWSYESVLQLYRNRIEDWTGATDPEFRGTAGKVHVQNDPNPSPMSYALLDAAQSAGLSRFPNANGRMMEEDGGCALIDETVLDGGRQSIFRSYLYPMMDRPNVTVLTAALVSKVVIEDGQATGVEFLHDGKRLVIHAEREVVLSLGAIHTPKVLMQSGIGNPDELQRLDIPVVAALPGVGVGLHDHLAFGCMWESTADGLPPVPRSQIACFWKSRPELDAPNFYTYAKAGPFATPDNAARYGIRQDSWSLIVGMRPQSRGSVHLTGRDATDPVRVDANYLSDPQDMEDLKKGIRIALAIGGSPALSDYSGKQLVPLANGEELEQFFRDGVGTFWHQSSTARMGRDPMSVVDGRLNVHGVARLRVADASILPRVTTGNTMAPCVVIGEMAAKFMLESF